MDGRALAFAWFLFLHAASTLAVDSITISDKDSFNAFQNRVNKGEVPVDAVLACDLDLSTLGFTKPIGKETVDPTTCIAYSGTFDGQGHTIKGMNMSGAGNIGLFCELSDATVMNLFLEADSLIGNTVGTLSGRASNGLTLKNVHSSGNVLCETDAGGLVGMVVASSLSVENCSNRASVTVALPEIEKNYDRVGATAGGIFGMVEVHGSVLVKNCWNEGAVKGEVTNYMEAYIGGLIGLFRTKNKTTTSSATFTNCTNTNNVECDKVDICMMGGIIGHANTSSHSTTLSFERIQNTGFLQAFGFSGNNIGGVVGLLRSNNSTSVTFSQCKSLGKIWSHDGVIDEGGGEGGSEEGSEEGSESGNENESGSENGSESGSGEEPGSTSESLCGGFIGSVEIDNSAFKMSFNYCEHDGNVTTSTVENGYTGGFIGYAGACSRPEAQISFTNNINSGVIVSYNISGTSVSGGFIAYFDPDDGDGANVVFLHCTNQATLHAAGTDMTKHTGGFVGNIRSKTSLLNLEIAECINRGDILFEDDGTGGDIYVGGFIGEYMSLLTGKLVMKGDTNYGKIVSSSPNINVQAGGLAASLLFDVEIRECTVAFTDCINYGNINLESVYDSSYACGLFAMKDEDYCTIEPITSCSNYGNVLLRSSHAFGLIGCSFCQGVSVFNSLNKGNVDGFYAFGIIEGLKQANNVASLGTVNGDADTGITQPLWGSAEEFHNSFTIRTTNDNDTGVIYVKQNSEGEYVTEDGQSLASLMTKEALAKQYSMGWNSTMGSVPFITVYFSSFNTTVFFINGSKASESPLPNWVNKFKFVSKDDRTVFNTSMTINKDRVFVALCQVNLSVFRTKTNKEVEYGTFMKDIDELSQYLNEEYIIRDENDKTITYKGEDKIEDNINCVVVHNCAYAKDKKGCRKMEGCSWKNEKCHEKEAGEKDGLGGGAIAGISIAVVILVSGLIVGLLILFMNKKKNQNEESKKNEIELAKTCVIGGSDDMKGMECGDLMMATGAFQTNGLMAYEKSETITLLIKGKETMLTMKEHIGSGSFAKVWKAEAVDGSVYAVKKIETRKTDAVRDAEADAEMMERLDNKYIAKVYGCLETEKCLYTVMELFEMGSLDTVLQKNGLRPELRIPILLEIGLGMEYLHGQGIIHRDLKPGNVLVKTLDPSSSPMCKFVLFFSFPSFPSFSHSHGIDKHHHTD